MRASKPAEMYDKEITLPVTRCQLSSDGLVQLSGRECNNRTGAAHVVFSTGLAETHVTNVK